eukprot:PhM_4_TR12436/c0_g1_i1/m.88844
MLGHRAATKRWVDNLKPRYTEFGSSAVAWQTPYRVWAWKQSELYRQIYEAQMEHLRKVYRRQWYESFRVNADEYISVYNVTKAAQYKKWEDEMVAEDKKRRQEMYKHQARSQLHDKQRDLLREYYTKHFFFWYERASERLQSMESIEWVTKENLSSHVEKELDKYVQGKEGRYPMNFVGQMPMLERPDGTLGEAATMTGATWYNFTENAGNTGDAIPLYKPPGAAGASSASPSVHIAEVFDETGDGDIAEARALVEDEMESTNRQRTESSLTERTMADQIRDKQIAENKQRISSKKFIDMKKKKKSAASEEGTTETTSSE